MEIIILVLLTMLNGFFALSELSIISVNKNRVTQQAKKGSKSAQTVLELLDSPEDFLSAVQVGITLIGIISGAYGGAALSDDVRVWMLEVGFLAPYADSLSIVLVIGLITYFTIVIGELIPKTIALSNANSIALAVAPVIKVFTLLTMPLVKILSGSTNLVVKLLGVKEPTEEKMSEEEIRQIIRTAGRQGILAKEETELHQNIFTYADQRAKNLMTRRMDVEWLDINHPIEKIKEAVEASVHSRFPVCDGNFDMLVGVLHAKDFYKFLLSDRQEPLAAFVQKPIYVSESMLANAVLNTFKKQKQYMAVVVDEFGSVEGVITLHDLLESIVGDLPDMDEFGEPDVVRREDGSLLVSGSVSIHNLNRELKQEFIRKDSDDFTTLAGFVIHLLGRFPTVGERLEHNGFEIEIIDMDGFKVDKVLLTKKPAEAAGPADRHI
ncbi:hemolysin family protein [Pontibacter russatus]|uniref:hemolysin family protein n=1 Tax=Pontibacter russatus TaxID=2694929 RepID=UPI0013799E63|nr:hemolysin family protein [Pontibacter russatus]